MWMPHTNSMSLHHVWHLERPLRQLAHRCVDEQRVRTLPGICRERGRSGGSSGGLGGGGGAGETELQLQRRRLRSRIKVLKRQLEDVSHPRTA